LEEFVLVVDTGHSPPPQAEPNFLSRRLAGGIFNMVTHTGQSIYIAAQSPSYFRQE